MKTFLIRISGDERIHSVNARTSWEATKIFIDKNLTVTIDHESYIFPTLPLPQGLHIVSMPFKTGFEGGKEEQKHAQDAAVASRPNRSRKSKEA